MFNFNKSKKQDPKKKNKNKQQDTEGDEKEEEEYPPDVELYKLDDKLVDIKAQLGDKFTILYNQKKSQWDTQQTYLKNKNEENKDQNNNQDEDDDDEDEEDDFSQHDIQIVKSKIQKEQKRKEELLFEQQEREVEFKEFKRKFMIFEIKNQMLEALVEKEKQRYNKAADYKDFDFDELEDDLQQQNNFN